MTRRLAPALGALLLTAWPGVAPACPYCAATRGAGSTAYLATAVGLGLLPIMLGGGLALWLRARYKRSVPRAEDQRAGASGAA